MCLATDFTEYFDHLTQMAYDNNVTAGEVYEKYDVKRGLRNTNGTGVLVGLTRIADVYGYKLENGVKIPDEGRLSYRGIDIRDLVEGFQQEKRRGFEESVFLLLFGKLPTQSELADFNALLDDYRALPPGYTESMILKNIQ